MLIDTEYRSQQCVKRNHNPKGNFINYKIECKATRTPDKWVYGITRLQSQYGNESNEEYEANCITTKCASIVAFPGAHFVATRI
jgi:hypothetical protein